MVNPPALVHRPQSRSLKDLVHLFLPRVRFTCTTWLWSELLGEAAWDVVDVVGARRICLGCGRRGCGRSFSAKLLGVWSMWSVLGGAARDVVDVVGARRSCSAKLLGMWSAWSGSRWRLGLPRGPGHGERRHGSVGVHGQGCGGSESPVGEACELHGASTAMVGLLKELLVLPVALATVMGAKWRRWRSNEVRCGNVGLQWASSSAKVSAA